MQEELKNRVLEEAAYIVVYHTTIEKTAKHFKQSKTTVYADLTVRLKDIDKQLYEKVRDVLDYNASQRSSRGGRATAEKKKRRNRKKKNS